ncbi:class I SAM-dependent methyltransferase [Paramagnetospirillum magneticum]|uniref:SAM-dependent methyltransferase n=1 Tax=Paramagnetospirillum magneticum (strain ATCC 700264 / AMB-1) TaxID=342108 RepID=Q2W801_PARM1|nr:class I SAM-dependent methyltransferase [Paramagnetospirillum magneticum]BAE50024.1 SAM-dependent methyltransferase [Paramagnetospirillum magneticum AMB-1]
MKNPRIEMSGTATHWQNVWTAKQPEEVSWHQDDPAPSLAMIAAAGLRRDAAIIDVGGGASVLVDRLLERGYVHVAVLDIAEAALGQAAERLGPLGDDVTWIEADVLAWRPVPGLFDLWHDRAVLHFLTDPGDQARYVEQMKAALGPEATVILATFAPEGPETCSGLPVRRHDVASLCALLGPEFRLVEETRQDHVTPAGKVQAFQWVRFIRNPPSRPD